VYISRIPYKAQKVGGLFEKHDSFFSHYTQQVSGGQRPWVLWEKII
jgi:hypothetical protein